MKDIFKVRAHHGMCLSFFIGKGYSSTFVENMYAKKEYLETNNPQIEIIAGMDHICEKCPNNKTQCESEDKVQYYDHKVLELCNIHEHDIMSWKEYSSLVKETILDVGKRKNICGDCMWNEICEEVGNQLK